MSLARLAAAALALAATAAAAQAPGPRFDGVWDLTWQTRRGPVQRGYLVLTQSGGALSAEIRGRGSVRASGAANGANFVLRGSRMLVSYRLEGRIAGDRMEGALKVMSVERRFTGLRRPQR